MYSLVIANQTIVPFPGDSPRRYEELYAQPYSSVCCSPGCMQQATSPSLPSTTTPSAAGNASECVLYVTMAVYDWKWYSQLMVSLRPPMLPGNLPSLN